MRLVYNMLTGKKEVLDFDDTVVGVLGVVDKDYTAFLPVHDRVFAMRDLVDIARIVQSENTGRQSTIGFKHA